MAEFRVYFDEFGWRAEACELADPTWREDPTIPLNTLQGYISSGLSGLYSGDLGVYMALAV